MSRAHLLTVLGLCFLGAANLWTGLCDFVRGASTPRLFGEPLDDLNSCVSERCAEIALLRSGLTSELKRREGIGIERVTALVERPSIARFLGLWQLGASQPIEAPLHPGQRGVAGIFGAVSALALCVVVCLLFGQIQRSGDISRFSVAMAVSLVLLPTLLAIHIVLGRLQVSLNSNEFEFIERRGLLGHRKWRVAVPDVQGVWLLELSGASASELIIETNNGCRLVWLREGPRNLIVSLLSRAPYEELPQDEVGQEQT